MNGVTDGLLPSACGLSVLGYYLGLNPLFEGGISLESVDLTEYVSGASSGSVAGDVIISAVLLGVEIHQRWYHGWSHGIRRIQRDMEPALSAASERWLLNRFWFDYRDEISEDSWYGCQYSGDSATDHGTRPRCPSLEMKVLKL